MSASRGSNWIQTFSGKRFWPLEPSAADVDIHDIAHALSLICRFTGHVRRFYSVAQHAVAVSAIVSPQNALAGLLHDAAEAYLADVARPAKAGIPGLKDIELAIERAVFERFGLPWPPAPEIKAADDRLLATERRDLLGPCESPWAPYWDTVKPLAHRIDAWDPGHAERRFLQRFFELVKPAA
jgi:uncharacterized protein